MAPVTLEHHVDPDEDWDNDVPVQGEPKVGSVVGLDFFWKFDRAIGNTFYRGYCRKVVPRLEQGHDRQVKFL